MNINKLIGTLSLIWVIVLGLWWQVRSVSTPQEVAGETAMASGTLEIAFLDIGQGDATFLTFADGQQMLVDCAIDGRILEALGQVMPFYDRSIDYLVVTHPDQDHYGGCIDVMERFDIGTIVYTGYEKEETLFYHAFMDAVSSSPAVYHQLSEPERWQFGSTTIDFLYPLTDLQVDEHIPGTEKVAEPNNTSIVMLIDHGDTEILMTGDAEEEVEEFLLREYGTELDVDILKAGHHGSNSSSIEPFVEMTSPSQVVFSAGFENRYGHPTPRVLKRFERQGSTVWRTDLMGDIVVTVTGEHVMINTETYPIDTTNN